MDAAQVSNLLLSLPNVSEEPHFEKTPFRVNGKIFATIPADEEYLHIFLDEHAIQLLVPQDPAVFHELWWGKRLLGVKVYLPAADEDLILDNLEESWRYKAPKQIRDQRGQLDR